jgi:hypothetical protein
MKQLRSAVWTGSCVTCIKRPCFFAKDSIFAYRMVNCNIVKSVPIFSDSSLPSNLPNRPPLSFWIFPANRQNRYVGTVHNWTMGLPRPGWQEIQVSKLHKTVMTDQRWHVSYILTQNTNAQGSKRPLDVAGIVQRC